MARNEARRGAKARRRIRISPDYATRWPIWDADDDDTENTLQITDELRGEISAWNAEWEAHFHYLTGWDSRDRRDAWVRWGEEVVGKLQRELGEAAEIVPEFRDAYSKVAERHG